MLLKSSRFNHSCASNAELVWRKEEKEGSEIRAVSKIKAGDEVTINFDILNIGLRRISERQGSMKVKQKILFFYTVFMLRAGLKNTIQCKKAHRMKGYSI